MSLLMGQARVGVCVGGVSILGRKYYKTLIGNYGVLRSIAEYNRAEVEVDDTPGCRPGGSEFESRRFCHIPIVINKYR